MIARQRELQLLDDCLTSARSARAAVVLVHGEAGLGKSRLVESLVERARETDVLVGVGHCTPVSGIELPFGPFVEMLSYLEALSESADESTGVTWELLQPVLTIPAQSAVVEAADVGLARSRLFTSVLRILHHLSRSRPVLIVVEDIHWADSSSLDLLNYLARTAGQERVLVVLTCQDDAVSRAATRRAIRELSRADATHDIWLGPLAAAEIRELLAEGDVRLPTPLRQRVVELSDGNPFIALELASTERVEGAQSAALRQALLGPVDELPEETRFALLVAAALGQYIPHDLLESAVDSTGADVAATLRLLTQRGLLTVADEHYVFRHSIVRESVLQEMLPSETRAANQSAVQGLRRTGRSESSAGMAQLAHHLVAAGDYASALPVVMAAATYARSVYAFAEARRQLTVARNVLWHRVEDAEHASGVSRSELLRLEAEMSRWAGEPARAARTVQQGMTSLPPTGVERTRLELELGEALWAAGDPAGALAAYQRSDDALSAEPEDPALHAKVLAALAKGLMVTGQYDAGVAAAEQAITLADSAGADVVGLQARITLATAVARQGELERGTAELRRCLREALGHEAFDATVRCYGNLVFLHSAAGQLDQAQDVAAEAHQTCERFGPLLLVAPTLVEGWINALVATGRWDEAEALYEELNQEWPASGMALALNLQLAHVAVARGDGDRFQKLLSGIEAVLRPDDPYAAHDLALLRTELLLWQGDPVGAHGIARESLDGLRDEEEGALLLSIGSLALRAQADVLATRANRTGQAALAEVDVLLATVRIAGTRDTGPLDRAQLALCEAEAARATGSATADTWASVAQCWLDLGCPFPAAYAQWRQAEELFGGRARTQGTAALASAYRTAIALRARPLEDALRRLARFAGVPLTTLDGARDGVGNGDGPAADGPAVGGSPAAAGTSLGAVHLTPRERDVLLLVTKGLSNQQIARQLFISESTASVHVSRVITKLGVSNRLQAATVAQRLHLFPDEV